MSPDLLTRDGRLLVAARAVRMFAYGFLSVILALYLFTDGERAAEERLRVFPKLWM